MALATATVITDARPTNPLTAGKGTYTYALRSAAVLTTSYVATDHFPVTENANAAVMLTCASVDYTSIQAIAQGSIDGTNFFDIRTLGGTNESWTLANQSSATAPVLGLTIPTSCWRFIRVLVKRTGGTAVGTCAATGVAGAIS